MRREKLRPSREKHTCTSRRSLRVLSFENGIVWTKDSAEFYQAVQLWLGSVALRGFTSKYAALPGLRSPSIRFTLPGAIFALPLAGPKGSRFRLLVDAAGEEAAIDGEDLAGDE